MPLKLLNPRKEDQVGGAITVDVDDVYLVDGPSGRSALPSRRRQHDRHPVVP